MDLHGYVLGGIEQSGLGVNMAFAKIESTYIQGNRGLKSDPVSSGVGVAEGWTYMDLSNRSLIYGNL